MLSCTRWPLKTPPKGDNMKLFKTRVKATAATLVFGALSMVYGTAQADVKVGFSGVLSGPVGILGQEQYDGFMLAVEMLQGKLGGQNVTGQGRCAGGLGLHQRVDGVAPHDC
jgi:hypothetical protein